MIHAHSLDLRDTRRNYRLGSTNVARAQQHCQAPAVYLYSNHSYLCIPQSPTLAKVPTYTWVTFIDRSDKDHSTAVINPPLLYAVMNVLTLATTTCLFFTMGKSGAESLRVALLRFGTVVDN